MPAWPHQLSEEQLEGSVQRWGNPGGAGESVWMRMQPAAGAWSSARGWQGSSQGPFHPVIPTVFLCLFPVRGEEGNAALKLGFFCPPAAENGN